MYFNIIKAVYVDEYRINLKFKNNKTGIVNLSDYISSAEVFHDLKSLDNFKKFSIDYGTLTWNNGEIDIAPETLYEKATSEKIVFGDNVQKAG